MRKSEKTREISEFDFFAISANMKKTQENRRDCLNWTNLKIPLHFWKKVLPFLRFIAQLENRKKFELFFVFWGFKKVKKWILSFLCFLNSEFCKSRIAEIYLALFWCSLIRTLKFLCVSPMYFSPQLHCPS